MREPLKVRIAVGETQAAEAPLDAPLEMGRQRAGDPPPYQVVPAGGGSPARLIIAPQHDKDNISRRHLTLTPLTDRLVRVENHSQAPVIRLGERTAIAPGAGAELAPPFSLALASCQVSVVEGDSIDADGIHVLDEPTQAPGSADEMSLGPRSIAGLMPSQMRALIEGMPRTLGVLQSAVGAGDFQERASQALVQTVGLDTGRVLLREGTGWAVAAAYGATGEKAGWRPSEHVLTRLLRTRSAVWQQPRSNEQDSASLMLLDSVVAAPLLDRHKQVIGALYGERRKESRRGPWADTRVEALLVNLLACGVSTGLARMEQEKAALRATTLFEQFFSRELARHLASDPGLLDGREAAVTVMFADVRSFSKYTERLGPAVTFRWINDVLGELSRCVQEEAGVLVDYIGDELMAMWGAPQPQADQAARAVRAALAMQAATAKLDERWHDTLGEPIRLGIGINSGTARVGNTGSSLKFKYGPLGNTVNLAARVRGLTKYLGCGVLITAATRQDLPEGLIARRVIRARVVNIQAPVDLYEVEPAGAPQRQTFFAKSQAALEALEAGLFAEAARAAGGLLGDAPGDKPTLVTLARASDALVRGGEGFDPVWSPPGK